VFMSWSLGRYMECIDCGVGSLLDMCVRLVELVLCLCRGHWAGTWSVLIVE